MRKLAAIAIALSLPATDPSPAGVKPCRDKDGKVVPCPKARKASPRCQDAKGRFVACPAPAPSPAGGSLLPS